MRARRALLYVPGDDIYKIRKATTLDVDCVCLDMEDGVAQNRKSEARSTIVNVLRELDFGRSERLARINPVGSGLEQDDLQAILPARPDGIVVPKVDKAEQVLWVCAQIDQMLGEDTPLCVIVIIESARAILNLAEIAGAHSRLQGLIFGAEDFAGDIGAVRTPQAWEVFYARSAVITHAAAYGLQAIDMVFVDFHDDDGLRQEALVLARKWALPVSRSSTPTRLLPSRKLLLQVQRKLARHCSSCGCFKNTSKQVKERSLKMER
jgi:citrate lyase beta subunit